MIAKERTLPNVSHQVCSAAEELIHGAGEMTDLFRAMDWSKTALGPLESWPNPLLVAVNLMLCSPTAIAIYWGAERVLLYNDGFRVFTGHRHPASLGTPGAQVWKESWHLLSGQCNDVFATGKFVSHEDFRVPLMKDGVLQDFYWTYSFSPIYDRKNVAGIFNVCQNTTDRFVAERKLRESEQRALRVLESIGDAVIVTDAEGRITRMNPVAEKLTGWRLEQAQGHPLPEIFHIVNESTRQVVEGPAEKVMRLGTVVGLANHTILIRRDGTEIHINDSGAPIRDDDGVLIGIVLVFRDIGDERHRERERAQVAARDHETAETQELLVKLLQWQRETTDPNAMMAAASEAVGRHLKADRVGFFEMVDESTSRLKGCWTAGELPLLSGDIPIARVGPEQAEEARLGRTRAVSDYSTDPLSRGSDFAAIGVRAGIGVPIIRHGQWQSGFYVHSATVREWTETEVAFTREVASQTLESVELALTQQAVRNSEARLRKILESIGDAVIVTNAAHIVTGMNPIAERLTGWTAGEAQGHALSEVFRLIEAGDERIEGSATSHGMPLSITEVPTQALLLCRGGKKLPVEQSGSLMRDDEGRPTGTVLIFRDITERENTERRVRQAYKMEALGQLTGGIAHDFNNILAIIMGNLELIAETLTSDSGAREQIAQAVASTEKAADLTRRLLAYARQQPLSPVVVDVVHLVHAAAEFIRRSLGAAIVLEVEVAEGLWSARVDRSQFENALLNLAVNARDAMPNGGRLLIDCQNRVFTEAERNVAGEVVPGEYLQITVTDTGDGMSSEALLRATEPFFTTKPVGQGTGLGLSMVYGFVKQSGGHMRIESELSVGTRVMLFLPRTKAAEHRPVAARERPLPEPLPRGNELVLIVEDEFAIRRTIGYLLNSLGYRVLEAEDGPGAMLHLQQTPGIDLLLTDVILPSGISGPELVHLAKPFQPEMKVIFTSGYTGNVLARDHGLDEHAHLLNKPFHLAELAKMLRRNLDLHRQ